MVVDPPLRQSPCCDPMESFSTSRDLTSLFPIGLLYLVDHPVLYKEIAANVDTNQTLNNSFSLLVSGFIDICEHI